MPKILGVEAKYISDMKQTIYKYISKSVRNKNAGIHTCVPTGYSSCARAKSKNCKDACPNHLECHPL